MRMKHTALLLTAGFILMPTLLWSQLPGQGGGYGGRDGGFGGRDGGSGGPGGFRVPGGPGGPGGPTMGGPTMGWGGGRSRMDPEQLFAQYSKDGQTLRKEDLPQQMQMGIDMFGPQIGLTGNQWTREDLQKATERVRSMMGGMMGGGAPGGMTFGRPGGPGGPGMGGPSDGDRDRRLDEAFKRLDQNEDGVLSYDELARSPTLQAEREKYDTNHNGVIELNEFRDYVTARYSGSRSDDSPGAAPRIRPDDGPPAEEEERKRPTLLRAGNIPRDFPYANLDTDLDGQVGLYEWKQAGRRISEFLPMDLNNDGYLTVDEYYRWRKQGDELAMKNGTGSREFGRMPGGMNMMAFNNPGMMPGGRFGMQGMTPGMPGMNNWANRMPGGPGMMPGGPGGMDMSNWRDRFNSAPGGMDMTRRWPGGNGGGFGGMSPMGNPMSPGNWANGPMTMTPGMSPGGPMGYRSSYTPGAMTTPGSYPMPGTGFGGGTGMPPGMSTMPFPGRGDRGPPGMNSDRGPGNFSDRGPGSFRDRGERGPGGPGERGPGERGPGGRRGGPGGDGGDRGPGRNRGE